MKQSKPKIKAKNGFLSAVLTIGICLVCIILLEMVSVNFVGPPGVAGETFRTIKLIIVGFFSICGAYYIEEISGKQKTGYLFLFGFGLSLIFVGTSIVYISHDLQHAINRLLLNSDSFIKEKFIPFGYICVFSSLIGSIFSFVKSKTKKKISNPRVNADC